MSSSVVAMRSFAKGETIFREGEVGRTAYLVREGSVKISGKRASGNRATSYQAGPGQVFGEHALITIGARPNTAIAEQSTKCVEIFKEKLTAKLKTEDAFVSALFYILAKNMRSMIGDVPDLETILEDLSEEGAASPPPPSRKPAQKASETKSAPADSKKAAPPPKKPAKPPAPQAPPASIDDDDDAFLI